MTRMDNIRMVDLKRQYERIKSDIDEAIAGVINNTAFINGPEVKAFARELGEYAGSNHVVTCANGTDALQLAMMALGFAPGDEVIVPAFTYVATAEVIALLRLKPVFVDVCPQTFNIDIKALEAAICDKTVGVVPVHLFGQCADMEPLMALARQHNLKVIADTAQAIGAKYHFHDHSQKMAGTIGDIGTLSFFPSKNLGCYGDGGAMFAQESTLAGNLAMVANHGQRTKYYHDIVGVNSRLDTLQAAILRVKLRHLDQYAQKRNAVAQIYDKAFVDEPRLVTPFRASYSTHVFHQYTLKLVDVDRDAMKKFLAEKGVPSMVYYPVPLHLQAAYTPYGYKSGQFPVAEQLCEQVLSLPIHTEMDKQQQAYIIEAVKSFLQ